MSAISWLDDLSRGGASGVVSGFLSVLSPTGTGYALSSASTTAGTATLTMVANAGTIPMTGDDIGKAIQIVAAGTSGADHYTTITGVSGDGLTITLAAPAPSAVTNRNAFWYPTTNDDTLRIQNAISACDPSHTTVSLGAGVYVISAGLTYSRYLKNFVGEGMNSTFIVVSSAAFPGDMLTLSDKTRGTLLRDFTMKHSGLSSARSYALVTAWQSVASTGVVTVTASHSFLVGDQVTFTGFTASAGSTLNDYTATITAAPVGSFSFVLAGALDVSLSSDNGAAHLNRNCISWGNTAGPVFTTMARVGTLRAPGDGVRISCPIISSFTGCNSANNNGHGFGFYETASGVNATTSTHFANCYANNNRKAGYYVNTGVYAVFTACAADGNGGSYYLNGCRSATLNSCGSEATSYRDAAYPGYDYYLHGGRNIVLNGCYGQKSSGGNALSTYLVIDNACDSPVIQGFNFSGSAGYPTLSFSIASGVLSAQILNPTFGSITNATTTWSDAGTGSTIFFDGRYQQTQVNWGAAATTPTLRQRDTSSATGQEFIVQSQNAVTTGGLLTLQSGTGTTAGDVRVRIGTTTRMRFKDDRYQWSLTRATVYTIFAEAQTSSTTQTTLASYVMTNETKCDFTAEVSFARQTNVTKAGTYKIKATYRRTSSGAPTIVGAIVTDTPQETEVNGVTFTFSGNTVRVSVTAADTDTRNWTCEMKVRESLAT